jgi:uncharacterized membrane-anchored protein YitT (DUF2179 family)
MAVGAFISAIAVIVFEAPSNIAPGGISGIAIILNSLIETPIGVVVLIGNVPIMLLAFKMLGGWRALGGTVFVLVIYSVLIDVLTPYFPPEGISDDVFLNAVFGGIVGGIGAGILYRGGATLGGTSTLARILQKRYGLPLSSGALYTDTAVIVLAGIVFGWELALYAMITLYIAAVVADYVLEGPAVIRTGVIITAEPELVSQAILHRLERGVTGWDGKGMFTGQPRTILYVTVSRPEVNELRRLVLEADPAAFVVIGQGHSAYGQGFKEYKPDEAAMTGQAST